MTKKTLEMHYTTIQTLQETDIIPPFLSLLQEKFTETVGTGHKVNCSVNPDEKQMTALIDGNYQIIANIYNYNVRSVPLTKMPEVMKIFETAKKELEEECLASTGALSALKPIMHIHSCTVEIILDSTMDRQYDYAAKKLIEQITRNKTIIMLR